MTSVELHRRMPRQTRGISLIEVMVGLVVGLLVTLAATTSAQLFTASQRQGIGAGSGSANSASALAAIKDDVSTGGMGFFVNGGYRCSNLNLSVGTGVLSDGDTFAPVQATRVGSNDVLDIVYSNDVAAGAWVELSATSDGSAATLKSLLPVTVAQTPAVLLAPKEIGTPCVVRTTTAAAAPTITAKQTLTFGNTGTHNKGTFSDSPSFGPGSPVILLGTLQWNRYSVVGGNLVLTRVLANTEATLLRNVMAFRVEYGVAAVNGTALQEWRATDEVGWESISNANMARVRAVRIGVVVRSAQREKKDKDGNCEVSKEKPKLFGNTVEPDVTDWTCYRYRSTEVIAPLRNIVHGTTAINWPDPT